MNDIERGREVAEKTRWWNAGEGTGHFLLLRREVKDLLVYITALEAGVEAARRLMAPRQPQAWFTGHPKEDALEQALSALDGKKGEGG